MGDPDEDDDDGLRAARGFYVATIAALAFWALIVGACIAVARCSDHSTPSSTTSRGSISPGWST